MQSSKVCREIRDILRNITEIIIGASARVKNKTLALTETDTHRYIVISREPK